MRLQDIVTEKIATGVKIYYHGSSAALKPGTILVPGKGQGLQSHDHPAFRAHEQAFESDRPTNCISRLKCIYLCNSAKDVIGAGGGFRYIYIVQPSGQVDVSDQAWWGMYSYYTHDKDYEKAEKCVLNYWGGIQFPDKNETRLEYRCKSAKVIKLAPKEMQHRWS